MATIEYRIDASGVPHTYVVINNGGGITQMYGFGPAVPNRPVSPGHIFDESTSGPFRGPHENDYSTGRIQVTTNQYNRVVSEINRSIAAPPYYSIPNGLVTGSPDPIDQCSMWANHLAVVGGFSEKLPWGLGGQNPIPKLLDYLQVNSINFRP
jgi:hypothetical protein